MKINLTEFEPEFEIEIREKKYFAFPHFYTLSNSYNHYTKVFYLFVALNSIFPPVLFSIKNHIVSLRNKFSQLTITIKFSYTNTIFVILHSSGTACDDTCVSILIPSENHVGVHSIIQPTTKNHQTFCSKHPFLRTKNNKNKEKKRRKTTQNVKQNIVDCCSNAVLHVIRLMYLVLLVHITLEQLYCCQLALSTKYFLLDTKVELHISSVLCGLIFSHKKTKKQQTSCYKKPQNSNFDRCTQEKVLNLMRAHTRSRK